MMQYLKKLWNALKLSTPDKPQELVLISTEQVARFIYHKKDWHRATDSKQKPKPKIFLPMIEKGQWETSVCRISNISEQRVWEIANRTRSPLPALARADLSTSSIEEVGLRTHAAPDFEIDYPEHAVIVGWAGAVNIEDTKERRLMLAVSLASASDLVVN